MKKKDDFMKVFIYLFLTLIYTTSLLDFQIAWGLPADIIQGSLSESSKWKSLSQNQGDSKNTTQVQKKKVVGPYTKYAVNFDYHSWGESMKFKSQDGTSKEVTSLNYGFAGLFDQSIYYASWGWGWSIGLGQGYGVAQGADSSYFQKRISWTYVRGGIRSFWRWNSRFDLGVNGILTSKRISWPDANGTLLVGQNPFFSLFAEMRWRISRDWELIQGIGTSSLISSPAFRLGIGYTL